ncbi:MAG: tRNA pseudouridine(55) synthase TruB [Candidatus Solibacter usitatus]|nr:tRNA pseudouridine(55) synthase TruB [Candidatus Solibacter usitatus]
MDGILVVDKPGGWTSHDVVSRMRRIAGTRKVGHLGTLDPIATGVLPLVIGRATRLAQFYTRNEKVYQARIRFGFSTDSYDRLGLATSTAVDVALDRAELERHVAAFVGESLQAPPPVSAKKIQGQRAYKMPREEAARQLAPVPVQIYELTLGQVAGSEAELLARCSGGTYLRSIAHDLGQALGCGAHLSELRRLRSGEFTIEQARSIPQLEELAAAGRLTEALIPAADLLPEFPAVMLDAVTGAQVRQGRDFAASPFRAAPDARYVKAIGDDGELIAIGERVLPHMYHPVVVF